MKPFARMPNKIDIEDFKTTLNQEIEVYNKIERFMDKKRTSIVSGDVEQLHMIDNQLEQLTHQAQNLEKERLSLMVRMGRQGQPLNDLIQSLENKNEAQLLEQSRHQLKKTISSIQNLSQQNMGLLKQSIRFVEQSVELIASLLSPEGASYGKQGRTMQANQKNAQDHLLPTSTISREG